MRLHNLTNILPAQLVGALGTSGTSSEKTRERGFYATGRRSASDSKLIEVGDDQLLTASRPAVQKHCVDGDRPLDAESTPAAFDVPHLLVVGPDASVELDGQPPNQSTTPAAWLPQMPSPVPSTASANREISQQELYYEGRSATAESVDQAVGSVSISQSGGRGHCTSAFAAQLAMASQRAPQRLAERFSEQLQQLCLDEAAMGQINFTWDLKLPSGKRSFLEAVAREFVYRVEALGFEKVEWWTGREWRKSQGRFHILHDNVYNKYHMRLRVRWTDRLTPEDYVHEENTAAPQNQSQILEQLQQTLEMQRQMLEEALVANTKHANTSAAEEPTTQKTDQCHTQSGFDDRTEGSPEPEPLLPLKTPPVAPVPPNFGPWPTAASSPEKLRDFSERK